MMDLTQLMHAAEEILREDGERILAMKGPEVFTKEGHANFVTSADLESQRFLVERLTPLLPGAGGEGGQRPGPRLQLADRPH